MVQPRRHHTGGIVLLALASTLLLALLAVHYAPSASASSVQNDAIPPVGTTAYAAYLAEYTAAAERAGYEKFRAQTKGIKEMVQERMERVRKQKRARKEDQLKRKQAKAAQSQRQPAGRRMLQTDNTDATFNSYHDNSFVADPSYPFLFNTTDGTEAPMAFDLQSFGSKWLPYRPLSDPYVISDNIAWLDITKLQYTQRDWERWDGFDVRTDMYFTPTSFGGADNENQRLWGVGNGKTDGTIQTANIASIGAMAANIESLTRSI
jgi:hypothetical protein